MGQYDMAEMEAEQAVQLCDVTPDLSPALAVLAHVRLRRGRVAEALQAAAEAMRLLETLGGQEESESLIRVVFAEALDAGGDHEAAQKAIRSAKAHLLARAQS